MSSETVLDEALPTVPTPKSSDAGCGLSAPWVPDALTGIGAGASAALVVRRISATREPNAFGAAVTEALQVALAASVVTQVPAARVKSAAFVPDSPSAVI